jgi:NAD(P)-dependent dehydrogenase (short-subunit alcohol dehydrogenase family)
MLLLGTQLHTSLGYIQHPGLPEKVFVVTRGNVGIGKEMCNQLLLKNAKVYLAAHSEFKAQAVPEKLEKETGKKAIWILPRSPLRSSSSMPPPSAHRVVV